MSKQFELYNPNGKHIGMLKTNLVTRMLESDHTIVENGKVYFTMDCSLTVADLVMFIFEGSYIKLG